MPDDTWRPWPGDERYLVSDRGQVWSPRFNRPLKLHRAVSGYHTIGIGHSNTQYVHRMVLETFAGPCPEGWETRHLNDMKTDNRWPENLCWGTVSQNKFDRVRNGGHHNAEKERCRAGHLYEGENLYMIVFPDGRVHRMCRKCHKAACRRYEARLRGRTA